MKDVLDADAAGDAGTLWVALQSVPSPAVDVRVFARSTRGAWRQAPALPVPGNGDSSVQVAVVGGRPCVAFRDARGAPRQFCLRRPGWRELPRLPHPYRDAAVNQLATVGGKLTILARETSRAEFRVLEQAEGAWRTVGNAIELPQALVRISQDEAVEDGELRLLVEDVKSSSAPRAVLRLTAGGDWKRDGDVLRPGGLGPHLSGPVVRGSRTYAATTVARSAGGWPFSVWRRDEGGRWSRVGAKQLNRKGSSGQGVVGEGDAAVWAAWQEHRQTNKGFVGRVVARELDPGRGREQVLWSGRSIGPGTIDVVSALGRAWCVYLAPGRNKGGLGVRVRPLSRTS